MASTEPSVLLTADNIIIIIQTSLNNRLVSLTGACRIPQCIASRCQCLLSSPHHPITPSPHHPITPSPHHPITPSPHHPITPSPHHPIITPSPHHPITPSPHHPISHPITPSPHHPITPSPHHPITPSPTRITSIILLKGNTVILVAYDIRYNITIQVLSYIHVDILFLRKFEC